MKVYFKPRVDFNPMFFVWWVYCPLCMLLRCPNPGRPMVQCCKVQGGRVQFGFANQWIQVVATSENSYWAFSWTGEIWRVPTRQNMSKLSVQKEK